MSRLLLLFEKLLNQNNREIKMTTATLKESNERFSFVISIIISIIVSSSGFSYFIINNLSGYAAIITAFTPALLVAGLGIIVGSRSIQSGAAIASAIFFVFDLF